MKNLMLIFVALLLSTACSKSNKVEKIVKELPSNSIFQLDSKWQNQNDKTLRLADLRGKTLVMVMIYTSCKVSCPLLVSDMKRIEKAIDPNKLNEVSLVLVTIDPETDTPARLKEFAKTRGMDDEHWVFLRGNKETTQELANVLSMKYKKISPVDFSHSNIISVFNPEGELVSQNEGTGIDAQRVANIVNETVTKSHE